MMQVRKKIYGGFPGINTFYAAELAYVDIIRVTREGVGYNSSGTNLPGNREYRHTRSTGQIEFETNFNGIIRVGFGGFSYLTPFESITVIYKL